MSCSINKYMAIVAVAYCGCAAQPKVVPVPMRAMAAPTTQPDYGPSFVQVGPMSWLGAMEFIGPTCTNDGP
jgi:hypothetical protein